MADNKKNEKANKNDKAIIHCRVEQSIYDMLCKHCEVTGQTKTVAVKRALQQYCDKYKNMSKE